VHLHEIIVASLLYGRNNKVILSVCADVFVSVSEIICHKRITAVGKPVLVLM